MSPLLPPSLDDLERMAQSAWAALPAEFRALAGDVIFRIEEFADEQTLAEVDLEDSLELTGLYSGPDLTERSIMDPSPRAPMVILYRHAILFEWISHGDVPLDELVEHVLVHEIGHHFGLSDDDMDTLSSRADD